MQVRGFDTPAYLARLVEQGAVAQLQAFPMASMEARAAQHCEAMLVAAYSK